MRILLLFIVISECVTITHASFFDWTPQFGPKKDILCPQTCMNNEIDRCCSCNSISKYKSDHDGTTLEYIDIRGKGKIIDTLCERSLTGNQDLCSLDTGTNHLDNRSGSSVINSLKHTHGYLRYMPVNSCFVRPLINMNLANNFIMDIGNLSCYTKLETLNLKGNKITYVTNDTFVGLSNLRTLDLSDNIIQHIDPNTFADKTVEIFMINVAHNNMKTLDISNVLLQKTFCHLDYTSSLVGKVTNLLHMRIEKNNKYGSGNVTFANTSMSEHPFKSLFEEDCSLLESAETVSKQIFGIWKFDGSSIKCDCTVGRLLKIGFNFLERFYHKSKHVDLTCNYPDRLKGKNLMDIADDGDLINEMTCSEKPCHPSCTCLENPHTKRLIVNCTNAELTSIPNFVPKSCFKIDLLLNNNSIKTLEHRDFFNKLSFLDLSNNGLTKIEPSALAKLTSVIGIKLNNNSLSTLPHNIQLFHPDIIETGDTSITCDCGNLWIGEWRRTRLSQTNNTLYCKLKGKTDLILAENVHASDIGCVTDKPYKYLPLALGIILCVVSPIILLTFFCRGEVYILTRKIRARKRDQNFQFDLYLSFDENDESILSFVMSDLYPILMKNGYKVFIPCRDLPPGSPREEETIISIQNSRTVLIILSENYGNDENGWARTECKKAFQLYLTNRAYNVVVIKFGYGIYLKSTNTILRAFVRLGKHIDITNRHKNLYKEVITKIGFPKQELISDDLEEIDMVHETVSYVKAESHENNGMDIVHDESIDVNTETYELKNKKIQRVRGESMYVKTETYELANKEMDMVCGENTGVNTEINTLKKNEKDNVRGVNADLIIGKQDGQVVRPFEIHSRPNSNTSFVSIRDLDASAAPEVQTLTVVDF